MPVGDILVAQKLALELMEEENSPNCAGRRVFGAELIGRDVSSLDAGRGIAI
jgi:hypothetical protein